MEKKNCVINAYSAYKKWVINNPNVVTDVETVATWSSYFVAGKINNSPIVSELVYSLSKLMSMYNDKLIREAYGTEVNYHGLKEQLKICLTVIHYCEVFVELAVKRKWGSRGKWTAITLLQLFKCCSSLILLYRYKFLPVQHPPIPILQRKKFTEEKLNIEATDNSFTLKRSGRVIRRVDGAPPISLRDWQPVKVSDDERMRCDQHIDDLIYAETLHILKPLIHLISMRMFATKSWKQWLVSLGMDLASLKLYNKHLNDLPFEQRLEMSRRKLGLLLYLLKSPMYHSYSKNILENVLQTTSKRIPLMSYICGPILQYLNHWQDIYFYMWSL